MKNIVSLEEYQKSKGITIEVTKISAKGLWAYQVGKTAISGYTDKDNPIHQMVRGLTLLSLMPTRVRVRWADGSEAVMGAVGVPIMWRERNGEGYDVD